MWHRLKDLWTNNRILFSVFLIVVMLTGFFGIRAANHAIYWSNPDKLDQPLAGWMTPRYVGQSYQVPDEVVKAAFQMEVGTPTRRISLERLAAESGMTIEEMQVALEKAVAAWRVQAAQ